MRPSDNYRFNLTVAGFVLLLANAAVPVQARMAEPGKQAMTAQEIADLYRGKTWVWPDGGGYFSADTVFKGWSGSGPKASYAEGRWSVTNNGRLCMNAVWHVGKRGKRNTTCFAHRMDGDVIYQRKLPKGEWYAFRNAPPKPEDEFMKLKVGDLVDADISKAKMSSK